MAFASTFWRKSFYNAVDKSTGTGTEVLASIVQAQVLEGQIAAVPAPGWTF